MALRQMAADFKKGQRHHEPNLAAVCPLFSSSSTMSPTASKSPSPPPDATPEATSEAAATDPVISAQAEASTSTSASPAQPSPSASTSVKQADDDSAEPEGESSADAVKDGADAESSSTPTATASAGAWQAIWSPQYNAYYFFNSLTQQTTWENPLQPMANDTAAEASTSADPSASASPAPDATSTSPSTSSATPASLAQIYALQEAAAAQGIDPSLAYLDPSLAGPSGPSGAGYYHTAKFNARTGAFARPDARDPGHLSEFERAKRMSEVYFDVGAWEKEVEARKQAEAAEEEAGKKRKRPSKKDVVRYFFTRP